MGQGLPKAVTSVVCKRINSTSFRIGFAEMNGWRPSMEDAHVIFPEETWGFFGVFDGHGGDQCSAFIAKRINEELVANGAPEDDAGLIALALRLDQEFLDSQTPSGSTGTFVIVKTPSQPGGQYKLRVGNIGDSRVILGHADGTIFKGPGTDFGLTTDHKPDLGSERERIERCGGTVQDVMGVSRVNGDLAVSRAFGDSQHKLTGGPSQEDHPVSASPELDHFECGPTDFLLLVCDGISEGSFPNPEVVKLAAEKLKPNADGFVDIAKACAAVCHEALRCGSKDNLSCMIVLLGGGELPGPTMELLPGPFEAPKHAGYRKAYTAMSDHASLSLAQTLELRYSMVQKELQAEDEDGADDGEKKERTPEILGSSVSDLRAELQFFTTGPPADLAPGSEERVAWFNDWLEEKARSEGAGAEGEGGGEGDGSAMSRDQLLDMLHNHPRLLAMAESQGLLNSREAADAGAEQSCRSVRVAPYAELRPAVESHQALKWDDRLAEVCGTEGVVIRDDETDGTSQVRFPPPLGFKAWLPTNMLHEFSRNRSVKIASVEDLRPAVEAHAALKWDERLASAGGQEGLVLHDDETDGTSQVRFPSLGFTAWFPTSTVTDLDEE
mmetsp:Transcript_25248/g.40425  ORF Transcript_25248/g.40425 Transcript_25248/m.40425 type:complete len:612 (+) Transcript_25248:99-1934(+)